MSIGYVLDRGHMHNKQPSAWVEGDPEPSHWFGLATKDRQAYVVHAYRCTRCGYLEFYANAPIKA